MALFWLGFEMNSAFDSAFEKCDAGLKAAFGSEVRLHVGGDVKVVLAELDRSPSIERFAVRGNDSITGRLNERILITFLQADVPADVSGVRIELDGDLWKLADPVAVDGDVEYLLVKEAAASSAGADSTFLNT